MHPVFTTSRLDAIILYAAYIIWILPEVISSFTDRTGKNKGERPASGLSIASIFFRFLQVIGLLLRFGHWQSRGIGHFYLLSASF